MNFDFSDEQKQLRDEARKFLAEKCPPKAVRTVLDGKETYDKDLWKGLAEMGFLGVAIPEEFGGAGAGHLELCVIAEEIGRALAPVPFSSTVYLAAEAILLAGSAAQKKKWLPAIASGQARGTAICAAVLPLLGSALMATRGRHDGARGVHRHEGHRHAGCCAQEDQ